MSTLPFKVGGGTTKHLAHADFLDAIMVRLRSHQTSKQAKKIILNLNRNVIADSPFQDAILEQATRQLGEAEALEALGL